jgi:protein MpaA
MGIPRIHALPGIILLCAVAGSACKLYHTPSCVTGNDEAFYQRSNEHPVAKEEKKNHKAIEFGKSVEGRPITGYVFGEGSKTVALIGGLHGDQPGGETVLNNLVTSLEANPQWLKGTRVVILPSCNPDGLVAENRCNARGVDLNLNFPTVDWRAQQIMDQHELCGQAPASEPETLAIIEALKAYPPQLLFNIQSAASCINYEGKGANKLAFEVAEASKLPVESFDSLPGSIETLIGKQHKVPCLTIDLEYHHKRGVMPPFEKDRYTAAILCLLRDRSNMAATF